MVTKCYKEKYVDALTELFDFNKKTLLLQSVAGRTAWDQEAMMPKKGAGLRSQEMGALEEIIHTRRQDKRISDWLDKAKPDTEEDKRKVELIKRGFERAKLVPVKLATELAEVSSEAQIVWQEARKNNSFSDFSPYLKKVVNLKREEAAHLTKTGELYDGLINDYEHGMTKNEVSEIFNKMKPRLLSLKKKISQSKVQISKINGDFDTSKQLKLSKEIARIFHYDFDRGRIDTVTHPFCSGNGDDVRVTTRTEINDPFNCIYSTIHEVGHASYEQNVNSNYNLTPLGSGVSLGIHESQSRIFENQLGRSRAFTKWLFKKMKETFSSFDIKDEEEFYRIVNKVSPGFIRTEADEVHYNLHIMLRFELEIDIISKEIEVEDIVDAWNSKFKSFFDKEVKSVSDGALQDVHWSLGAFGYFPTYTLGNLNAGCLFEAMKSDLPSLDKDLENGEIGSAKNWLTKKIHQYGSLYEPKNLMEKATGKEFSVEPLISYLEEKFTDLYFN